MSIVRDKIRAFSLLLLLIPVLGSVVSIQASQAALSTPAYDLVVHVPNATLPASAAINIAKSSAPSTVVATTRLEALDNYGWWGVVQVPANAGSICFAATALTTSSTCIDPISTQQVWLDKTGIPYLSRIQAAKDIKVHLSTTNKTGRTAVLTIGSQSVTQPFVKVGTTDFVADFTVSGSITSFSIKTQSTKSKKLVDDGPAISGDASKLSEIYLVNGGSVIYSSIAQRDNFALIHYHRDDNNYKSWGAHLWMLAGNNGAASPTLWVSPKTPISSTPDSWGVTFKVPLTTFANKLPFIIHKGELKDPAGVDQTLDLIKSGYEIWLESGHIDADGNYLTSNPPVVNPLVDGLSVADATALATDSPRSSFANDSIYFVMTDRYKNGDVTNDKGGSSSNSRSVTGFDAGDPGYSHGGDLSGLSDGCSKNDGSGDGLPRIKRLGFSAVWITPPFKQNFVQGGSAAYHGYWIDDFTQIDPHWGTNAQFKTFVDCAHRLGMKVVMDIVMNHTGDVIQYRDGNYNFHSQPNTTAFIPSGQESIKAPAFLNDINNYHNQGNVGDWGNQAQYQNGDFFGLDDIKTENDAVINGFASVYSNWINNYGVDGFRIDTAKHVDNQFFSKWWPKVLEQTAATMNAKSAKLFAFGEFYDSSSSTLGSYVRKNGLPSALDFAFQSKVLGYAAGGGSSSFSDFLNQDNLFVSKNKSAYDLVTFLGNHDMGRSAFLINQGGTTRSTSLLLANDLMFLTRGIPSVYYGDEVGFVGSGGDKASRQDMFATKVSQWLYEDRVWSGIDSTTDSFNLVTPLTTRIAQLNALRKLYPALASGAETVRNSTNNTLVVSRLDKTDRREYLVAFNSGNSAQTLSITTSTPASSWSQLLGGTKAISSNSSSVLSITVPARGTVVYRAANQLPDASSSVSVSLGASVNSGNQSVTLSSNVSTTDLGSVTWVMKQGDQPWSVLGTDDSQSFGMTWDYQPYVGDGISSGTKLSLVAIYRSTSGAISVSAAKQITIP
jgi:glycosidase